MNLDPENFGPAIDTEIKSFEDIGVFKTVKKPKDVEILFPNWVMEIKWDGRHKARMTVNGRKQQKGEHYSLAFAATLDLSIMRMIMTIMISLEMEMGQYDVPTAFCILQLISQYTYILLKVTRCLKVKKIMYGNCKNVFMD